MPKTTIITRILSKNALAPSQSIGDPSVIRDSLIKVRFFIRSMVNLFFLMLRKIMHERNYIFTDKELTSLFLSNWKYWGYHSGHLSFILKYYLILNQGFIRKQKNTLWISYAHVFKLTHILQRNLHDLWVKIEMHEGIALKRTSPGKKSLLLDVKRFKHQWILNEAFEKYLHYALAIYRPSFVNVKFLFQV